MIALAKIVQTTIVTMKVICRAVAVVAMTASYFKSELSRIDFFTVTRKPRTIAQIVADGLYGIEQCSMVEKE